MRYGQSQGTEAPSTSKGDVKMPTKDQAVTESKGRNGRDTHIHTHTQKKNITYGESTADEIRKP